MSGADRILWIYVQQSYLGTTDVAIGGDNGLYLPGEKQLVNRRVWLKINLELYIFINFHVIN